MWSDLLSLLLAIRVVFLTTALVVVVLKDYTCTERERERDTHTHTHTHTHSLTHSLLCCGLPIREHFLPVSTASAFWSLFLLPWSDWIFLIFLIVSCLLSSIKVHCYSCHMSDTGKEASPSYLCLVLPCLWVKVNCMFKKEARLMLMLRTCPQDKAQQQLWWLGEAALQDC